MCELSVLRNSGTKMMSRLFGRFVSASVLLGWGVLSWAQQGHSTPWTQVSHSGEVGESAFIRFEGTLPTVDEVPHLLRAVYPVGVGDDWLLKKESSDALGYVHLRYQQLHAGKPVLGGVVTAHCMAGKVVSLSGRFVPAIVTGRAGLSEAAALEIAIGATGAKRLMWEADGDDEVLRRLTSDPHATWKPTGELWYVHDYLGGMSGYRLAWKLDIYSRDPLFRADVYVDAETGNLLFRNETLTTADAHGVGHSRYSGVRPIVTDSTGSHYRLRESGRAQGVETYNMLNGTDYNSAVDFVNSDNVWDSFPNSTDNSAIDAHWGAEMTHDYFQQFHGRNSYDDAGSKLISYIHYDHSYSNAFWNGTFMTYGDGGSNNNPFQGLDVCGHEFTHGVTQYSAGLIYQNEPGALNESFSDIFGNTIEFWARPNNASWWIGDDIGAFRSMSDPNAYLNPDTYKGSHWAVGTWDNGGVHINSGVQNYWYYLLSVGGSGVNDHGDSYSVTGIGIDSAAAIAYRNLTAYLSPADGYAEARFYSIQAAADLFGECSPQMIQTMNAWHAVGVGLPYTGTLSAGFFSPDTNQCTAPVTVQFTNLSTSALRYLWDFGDGATSTAENPSHTYTFLGDYTVTLIAYGCNGSTDTLVFPDRIHIDLNQPCTVNMPIGNDSLLQTGCEGNLYDSGGANDYLHNSNSRVTIQPGGNSQVHLTFHSFNYAAGDRITVYDGPSLQSPQVGVYTGTSLPAPIVSTNGALTIKESTNGANNREGFYASWTCATAVDGQHPHSTCEVYPNPASGFVEIRWGRQAGEQHQVLLMDALGRVVLHTEGHHGGDMAERLNVAGLARGVYTLVVKAGTDQAVKRLIVQ